MLADIATGNTGTADVLFLIAAIVFAIAAIRPLMTQAWEGALVPVGLCLVAIALMVL